MTADQSLGGFSGSEGQLSAGGSLGCRKRSVEAISSHSSYSTADAAPRPRSSGADAAFISSLHAPRRQKVGDGRTPAAAARSRAATLRRSAGSSTQLAELGRQPSAEIAAHDVSGAADVPACSSPAAGGRQWSGGDAIPPAPAPPACLLRGLQVSSGHSSSTSLWAGEDSPSSEPEFWQPDSAARWQQPGGAAHEMGGAAVGSPSLRQVAIFEHPQQESWRSATGSRRPHADIVCDVKFSPDGALIATAGVGKQIRAYSLTDALRGDSTPPPPVAMHRMPAKLSSLAWSPASRGVITVGDYDGSVQQVHLESGHFMADADEHNGRRCVPSPKPCPCCPTPILAVL